jgi:hypothetical protein
VCGVGEQVGDHAFQPCQGQLVPKGDRSEHRGGVCGQVDTRSRAGAETSDQLKYLGERIPATFVYSGIDVESSPLLTGVRGSQLAGRFKIVRNQPLRYGSGADKQLWHDLMHSMDSALRLRSHRPGTLITHAAYLHARTGGRMGSLSHLVREAALVSLLDGTERITKKLLDQIELDTAAGQRARAPQRHKAVPRLPA